MHAFRNMKPPDTMEHISEMMENSYLSATMKRSTPVFRSADFSLLPKPISKNQRRRYWTSTAVGMISKKALTI